MVHTRAQFPDSQLGFARRAAVHVTARDAGTRRPAVPLNVWLINGADTLKARTNAQGGVDLTLDATGPVEIRTWFFNFVPTRDTIVLRAGFRDSVAFRLGRSGNECYIVPDRARS